MVLTGVRLSDVERGRTNNLNLLRLILASSVILSHSFDILNQRKSELFYRYLHFGANMGDVAVFVFFYISGFLILKSALRKSEAESFFRARVFRIFPALVVVILLSIFVLGPCVSELSAGQYFRNPGSWRYLLAILFNPHSGGVLPGVFTHLTIAEVNLPLWTLPLEWFMYCAAFFTVSIYRQVRGVSPVSHFSLLTLFVVVLFTVQTFPLETKYGYKAMLCFMAGSLTYLLRQRIIIFLLPALIAFLLDLALIRFVPPLGKMLFMPALFYFILAVGFHPRAYVRWFERFGDYSYGVYIYGWPVQQIVAQYLRPSSPFVLAEISYFFVLPLAIGSWWFVEKPDAWWRSTRRKAAR